MLSWLTFGQFDYFQQYNVSRNEKTDSGIREVASGGINAKISHPIMSFILIEKEVVAINRQFLLILQNIFFTI